MADSRGSGTPVQHLLVVGLHRYYWGMWTLLPWGMPALVPRMLVGGLGGGGDVGLSSIIVEGLGLEEDIAAVVSFGRCHARGSRGVGVHVRGALIRVVPEEDLGRRVFEDKLLHVAKWARDVYIICIDDDWRETIKGLGWIIDRYNPKCIISADIGGDGLLLGYERALGSYIADTLARAALAWASREHSVKGIVAVGGIGAEGGGSELSLVDLYATLSYLSRAGAILGGWTPSPGDTGIARGLLAFAESGMLPLYLAAVEGRSRITIRQAYLRGDYEVRPWYKHVLFLDAEKLCEYSPLCREAQHRGLRGLRRWKPPKAPHEYVKLKREAEKYSGMSALKSALAELVERLASKVWSPTRGC